MVTRVKICGLTRPGDVEIAVREGASAIGIMLDASSKRYVSDTGQLAELFAATPPYVARVAVFGILGPLPDGVTFDAIQFVEGPLSSIEARGIRAYRIAPGDRPPAPWPSADAILLDAKVEGLMGGTGTTVDEETARDWIASSPLPTILAGGLNPENVADKIAALGPYAVDVSSGVELSPGLKDGEKIRRFCDAVRGADEGRRKKTRGC